VRERSLYDPAFSTRPGAALINLHFGSFRELNFSEPFASECPRIEMKSVIGSPTLARDDEIL
jgi:hypothetical protein